jgi:hypothetical protein
MTWAEMNQYERSNAVDKVTGYMVGRHPTETAEQEFEKAKRECLHHLSRQIEQIEAMTFEQAFPKAR